FAPNIKEESTNLVTRLIEATEKYGSVDPLKNLELNAMNVILEATFGKRFKSVDDPEFRKLSEIVELSMKYAGLENDLSNFLPIISFVDNYTGRQYKWRKFMTTERNPAYEELIKQAMLKDSPNLMNALEENGYPMTMDEKIVFASDMVTAGTDTISVTLSWNFVLMCHHPEVQKRVSAEIDAFVAKHGHLPTFEERSEVPLCISVIKESMRFRPATFFGLPHTLHEEIEVDGYVIPKDATILASMHSMHLNPNCYTNPEKFIPDRFMDNLRTMQSCANGRIEERDHYNFGWGRRVCPGISLAEAEVFASFIQVYSRCFIEPADGKTMPDIETLKNVGLTVLPAAQKLKFTKRF
ncbi:cytochrome P450 1 sub A member 2, partial [Rhizopus stolonifer]